MCKPTSIKATFELDVHDKTGPTAKRSTKILNKTLTSSTCSVVKVLQISPWQSPVLKVSHHNGEGTALKWVFILPGKIEHFNDHLVGLCCPGCVEPRRFQKLNRSNTKRRPMQLHLATQTALPLELYHLWGMNNKQRDPR